MNEAESAIQGILTVIVRSLVDRPDDVTIELLRDETGTCTAQIRTNPIDAGGLIGEHGRTVHAIRVVVNAIAAKRGCGRFNIQVVELVDNLIK